jgi:spore coat polysaccharide biosynthesis protein SpsF
MKIAAIIQARMSSNRLPGKVLKDLAGTTMLARVVERVRRCALIGEVLIATSSVESDQAIVSECDRIGVGVFRGSELDVLDRYYQAARFVGSEGVVRITSDCPLIDSEVTGHTIKKFLAAQPDYACNTLERTFPRGLDTEVMTFATLECAWKEAKEGYQREHVTPYIYQNPSLFKLFSVRGDADYSRHRWTVDTPEDLEFVRNVYERFKGMDFGWTDVLRLLEREPQLAEINRRVPQKTLQ